MFVNTLGNSASSNQIIYLSTSVLHMFNLSCIISDLVKNTVDKCFRFVNRDFQHLIFSEVYNIVDDDPAPREEVFEYARKLVEKKWPGLNLQLFDKKDWTIVETRNLRGEKRVSNSRMKNELGVDLLYPDYRSGLQSIIDQIESPFFPL